MLPHCTHEHESIYHYQRNAKLDLAILANFRFAVIKTFFYLHVLLEQVRKFQENMIRPINLFQSRNSTKKGNFDNLYTRQKRYVQQIYFYYQ